MKWISVSDRLPDVLSPMSYEIYITTDGKYVRILRWMNKKFWDDRYLHNPIVTHWMPLPEPPQGEDDD